MVLRMGPLDSRDCCEGEGRLEELRESLCGGSLRAPALFLLEPPNSFGKEVSFEGLECGFECVRYSKRSRENERAKMRPSLTRRKSLISSPKSIDSLRRQIRDIKRDNGIHNGGNE